MYARVLRKWSLARFLMNLWLVVIMLLVICCQNATSMHLVKNTRSSRSSPYSLTSLVNTMQRNSDLGSTMTIYSPYGRLIDPYQYQLRQSQQLNYNQQYQDFLDTQLDRSQQQQQLLVNDGVDPRRYYSPYTIYIRTNADTAQVEKNVPNMNSQIINLNSNNNPSSSTYSSKDGTSSPPHKEQNPHSQDPSDQKQAQLDHHSSMSSSNLRYSDNRRGNVQHPHRYRGKTRDKIQGESLNVPARSAKLPVSSPSQALQPSAFDPIRTVPDWLQVENERRLRIERHRQRRHRHFEQIARSNKDNGDTAIDHGSKQNNNNGSSPISTITTNLGNNNDSNNRNSSSDNVRDKSSDPRLKTEGSNRGQAIANTQNKAISYHQPQSRYRRRRISRSHHPRRRQKRYCSARDPVQLAYLAPIVLEGKVHSMSANRRANFSASFQVTQIFKNRQNHNIRKLDLVRLQFTFLNTTGECDIYHEQFRERGFIRRDLQNARNYTLFLKYVGEKPRILGQPILSNQRVYAYVKNASQEKFGKAASIKSLTANRQNKVREKEELHIICKVRGNPPPKITWFKDDKSIKQSRQLYQFINLKRRSELIVKSFSNATAGLYECRAKNMVMVNHSRKVEKKTIRIEAYGRPENHNDTGEDCPSSMEAFCLNGGVCRFFSDINHYYCKCAEGFDGERCHEKRPTNVSLSMYPSTICGRSTYYGQSKC